MLAESEEVGMFKGLLDWLHDENNRAIVIMAGGAIGFLWTAAFAIYGRIQDQKAKREERGERKTIPPNERAHNKRQRSVRTELYSKLRAPFLLWAFGILGLSAVWYTWEHSEKTITSEFVVCSGEYERECPSHNVYIYCYEDPGKEAKKACKRHSLKTTQSKGGNKCGYTWTTYLCTNDAP
jgi:hypothetical protein